MTREEIIRMAREAGLQHREAAEELYSPHCDGIYLDDLERFASLVSAAEREACAAFLETGVDMKGLAGDPVWTKYTFELLTGCAAAIRARGQE